MRKLVIMIVCCTILAVISQRRNDNVNGRRYTEREQFFFSILVTYMVFFAGLRTHFNDTDAYIVGFTKTTAFPEILSGMNWTLGANPGFKIYMSIIKSFTDNKQIFLMISSAFVLYTDIWFIRKYTKSFALSVFLFFMLGYYMFALAAIKQTIATAFALIAIDRLIRGKKLLYVLFILIGMTFHPYAFLYFLAPVLLKQTPWQKGTWILILATLVAAYSFNFLMGAILDITDVLGEGYDAEAFVGEGINGFRVMVYFVPVLISFLWRRTLFEDSSKVENLFVNCAIVCAMIMFIGLFGNANMFARLAMYFEPPIYIALPWMLYRLKGKTSGWGLSFGAYIAFPMYFYYQMVITSNFDQTFSSISIWQFFISLYQ